MTFEKDMTDEEKENLMTDENKENLRKFREDMSKLTPQEQLDYIREMFKK